MPHPERQRERLVPVDFRRRQLEEGVSGELQRFHVPRRAGADGHALGQHEVVGDASMQDAVAADVQGSPLGLQRAGEAGIGPPIEPLLERRAGRGGGRRDRRTGLPQGTAQVVVQLAILDARHDDERRSVGNVAVHHVLGGVAEERRERVEVALRDRVELVVVAGRAADGQAEEDRARGVGAVLGVDHLVLFRDHAALVRGCVAAMESGSDQLVHRRVGQQVAGDLLHGEAVERQVAIEGVDDPVAIGPHLAVVVDVDAVRVGVARRVQPVARAVLPVGLGTEELVEVALVRAGALVREERREQRGLGRQSRDIERSPPRQRVALGLGRGREALAL